MVGCDGAVDYCRIAPRIEPAPEYLCPVACNEAVDEFGRGLDRGNAAARASGHIPADAGADKSGISSHQVASASGARTPVSCNVRAGDVCQGDLQE